MATQIAIPNTINSPENDLLSGIAEITYQVIKTTLKCDIALEFMTAVVS